MSWILGLFVIELIAVFVVDYSGFIQEMERYLNSYFKSKVQLKIPKPFSCSLCLSTYAGIIYLLIIHNFNFISLGVLVLFLTNTKNILHGIYTIQDLIESILNYFDLLINWFKK